MNSESRATGGSEYTETDAHLDWLKEWGTSTRGERVAFIDGFRAGKAVRSETVDTDTHASRLNALLEAARVAEIKLRDGGIYPVNGETWRLLRDALLPYKGIASTAVAEPIQAALDTICPKAEAPCETCNDDPKVCATVPGLRHCEAAQRTRSAEQFAIGEVMGHEQKGLALVQWNDNGLRPIGMKVYAAPQVVDAKCFASCPNRDKCREEGCDRYARSSERLTFDDGLELCRNVVADFQTRLRTKAGSDANVSAVIEFMDGITENINLLAAAKVLESPRSATATTAGLPRIEKALGHAHFLKGYAEPLGADLPEVLTAAIAIIEALRPTDRGTHDA